MNQTSPDFPANTPAANSVTAAAGGDGHSAASDSKPATACGNECTASDSKPATACEDESVACGDESIAAGSGGGGGDKDGARMLPRVVFLGRALRDYREMFDLEDFPAAFAGKKILDVGAGSATFATEALELGIAVTAVDPLYGLSVDALDKLSVQDQETSFAALVKHAQHYKADDAQLSHLRTRREATRRQFIDDYRVGLALGRYRKAELPHLPFEDNAFDVALCGNFLFLYGHLFGLDFHLQAIDELLRVAADVRLYPLVGLDSVPPPFAGELIARLQARTDITTRRIEIKSSILSNRVEGLLLRRPSPAN